MAAPMRDGAQDGQRPRADGRAAPRTEQPNNFEYDDNEWDIGIGDLIIDLDADIEKTDEGTAAGAMASAAGGPAKAAAAKLADHSATLDKGLKMKIKRTKPGTKTSEAKHEIVKSNELNGTAETSPEGAPPAAGAPPARRASAAHRRDKAREKHPASELNGAAAPAAEAPAPPAPASAPAPPEPPRARPSAPPATSAPTSASPPAPPASPSEPPPQKKLKTDSKINQILKNALLKDSTSEERKKLDEARVVCQDRRVAFYPLYPPLRRNSVMECADVCVGTSVGTITEPDCLGPCEPGTSVTLEGIVWHETEGGVLVVNVTWRGKTYVGTLLDCTRHDWAPPRFCDSPTEELDARTPKGRAKRGRGAAPGGDLSNFTETRSSVHSKLRNGGAKGRRGGAAGAGAATPAREAPSPPPPSRASPSPAPSPAPPAPSGKRKARGPEEDSPAGKRRAPSSPPASPALLECPEPNCSKKYKHINGLKYHQSHAHGAIDEDESKDVASMSENDESNAEAPSPAGPVKSPDKPQEPGTPKKEDRQEALAPVIPAALAPSPAEPPAPPVAPPLTAPPPSPAAAAAAAIVVAAEVKPPPVKPGVLRFGPQEDFPVANFVNKPPPASPVSVAPVSGNVAPVTVRPPESAPRQFSVLSQGLQQPPPVQGAPPQHGGHPPHPVLPIPNHVPHPAQQNSQMESALPQNIGPPNQQQKGPPPSPQNSQFKVKPTAALMPTEEKKLPDGGANKPQGFKKNSKSRKSPGGSPHPPERPAFGMEQTGREEVQSPAYSDISDDNAPVMENEVDKSKILGEKKPDGGTPLPHSIPAGYGMYQFFGQTPYLVPSVQNQSMTDPNKIKEDPNKQPDGKTLSEKDIKREGPPENMAPQKMLQHYYPYGYMPPGYPYNMDPNYGPVSMVPEDKLKEQQDRDRERSKESPSPAEHNSGKPPPAPSQQQGMMGGSKPKQPDMMKDGKHPNENHQILKESIEMKSQMNPYLYQRHQQHQAQQAQHHQREEEMRRYYMSLEQQRRKENSLGPDGGKQPMLQQQQGQNKPPQGQGGPPKPPSNKDSKPEDGSKGQGKEDMKPIKQEGQKPTMETTGPPPPPTSQYYLHPSYMQPPHYGGLPFDPMYRGLNPMLVSGPYGPGPYLHPGPMPRYHAPEDLSRAPPPAKALDLLQHHASQYYSSHKIHELQERALKSPTPKTAGAGGSPGVSAPSQPPSGAPPAAPPKQGATPPTAGPEAAPGKESRSPPPQRHVHTHHHTHVGLGYPLYPAPYGAAAVLASQRAAAVSVVNSFPPK